MTRAKAITYDNSDLARWISSVRSTRRFAKQVRAQGFDVDVEKASGADVPAYCSCARAWIGSTAPWRRRMCMYSAQGGRARRFPSGDYGSRAIGGAGLIFTEMTPGRLAMRRITAGPRQCGNHEQQRYGAASSISSMPIPQRRLFAARPCHPSGATKLMRDGMDTSS